MNIVEITKDNFESEVLGSEKPVLLDFSAQWCGPCHMIAPVIREIAEEREDLKVGKIDVDQQMELAQRFEVSSIPTLIAMKNGTILNRTVGVQEKEAMLQLFD